MGKFYIKKDDTASSFKATLQDSAGDPVNLIGASVKFIMAKGTTVKVNAAATLVDAANGIVRYDWISGDTDTSGFFRAEWQVTDSTSHIQTFPNPGYDEVIITRDLGS